MKLEIQRNYYCSKCKTIQNRQSDKKWIKSFCTFFDSYSRLILVKGKRPELPYPSNYSQHKTE